MLSKGHILAILFIGISVTTIHSVQASELPEITVTIIGDPVIVLNSQKNMIRANVEIENYDPRDGYYFMKVVDTSSGQILMGQGWMQRSAVVEVVEEEAAAIVVLVESVHLVRTESITIGTEYGMLLHESPMRAGLPR